MNAKVFNACLLAGWLFITLGGILYRPDAGLLVGGVALIALTLFVALRFGVYDQAPQAPKAADKTAAH